MKPQLCPVCLIVAAFLCFAPILCAGDVALAWDPVSTSGLSGYRLGYGSASGQYATTLDVGNVTAYTVSGLASGTYYFAVKARDNAGQSSAYSNEVTAYIAPAADTTPPVISAVGSSGITVSSATIVWTTDESSDSQVEYRTTLSYGNSTALGAAMVTSHSQSLSGLTAGTTYHYRVKSKDAAGNLAVSGDFTFTTSVPPDTTPPVISAVGSSSITVSSTTISWTTNESSDSQVEYGMTSSYGNSTALGATIVTSHSQSLSSLTAGTTYHYRVKSKDAAGNLAVSGDYTFATTSSTDITTGLAAAYAFDEGTGSVSADLSGNGNSAGIHSAAWTTGKYGKALSFNGTSSYLSAGVNGIPGANQPKTISCWIYLLTEPRSIQSILALANPSLKASVKYGYKSTQAGVLNYGGTWMLVAKLPSIKVWHHFGYVFDGSQNRLYIDGVLTSTSTIAPAAAAVTNFQMGRWVGGSQYFKGSIDDVRVYSRALTVQELQAAMNTPVGSSSALKNAQAVSDEEAPLSADKEEMITASAAQPAVNPIVDIQLERQTYRQGEIVSAGAFWISNSSDQSRDVEVKTWMALPGMLPISLDLSDADTLTLAPGFNQNYGLIPLLKISAEKISGIGEANARLIDPVTGDVLSEDINPFTVGAARRSRLRAQPDVSRPYVVLEDFAADSRSQYRISNRGAEAAAIEFKAWLEAPDGGTTPIFSVGADGSLILDAGSDLTLDPLASVRIPAGSFVVRARVLDTASGEILCETEAK